MTTIEQDLSMIQPEVVRQEVFPSEDSEADREYPLLEMLAQIARRKRLIAKVTGISTLIGLILCIVLPVHYTALTIIMPPRETASAATLVNAQLGIGALAAAAGGGGFLKDPNAIYVGLLKSRPIADAIISNFDLVSAYRVKNMTDAREKLADNTRIVSETSTLISIHVTDRDKKRAAAIANAYTDQLRKLTETLAVTEASQRRLFYENQLRQTKENLVAAELAFEQVQQNKGLIALDAQARAMIEGLALLRAQIAAKEVELHALRSFSTEHNPDVQMAERELSTMQDQATHMEQHSQPTGYTPMGLKDVPQAGLEYLRAERELQFQQALFDLLLKQYEAAKLDEAKEAAVIQIVEPAVAPDKKSDPKRALILLASLFLGLLIGISIAMCKDWFERTRANPEGARLLDNLTCALTIRRSRT